MADTKRISNAVREDLESIYQHLVIDSPYGSPEGEALLKRLLGYAVDANGDRVEEGK